MGDRPFPKSSADPTSYLESVQPLTMTIISELVLLDAGEPVPLDVEEHSVGYKKRSCISGIENDLREK